MKVLNRVAVAVCALAGAGILLLGFLPFSKARQFDAPSAGQVDCGSVFFPADWEANDECESENTGRGAVMVLLLLLALPFALAVAVTGVVKLFRRPDR